MAKTHTGPISFYANEHLVLRFYGYWDDRPNNGELHDIVIKFYLVDNTFEFYEATKECKKEKVSLFIRRGKIQKHSTELPKFGHEDQHTILNVLGTSLADSRYVYDIINIGKGCNDSCFYGLSDLSVGTAINVYGRKIVITDCDPFTKDYYRKKFGFELTPIEKPKVKPPMAFTPMHERELPVHDGFGSHEDSARGCQSFEAKPFIRNVSNFLKYDKFGLQSKILRFKAALRSKISGECGRKFIISYYLSDETMQVNSIPETVSTNTGCFMSRRPMDMPFQERYTSKPPDHFLPQHMYVGANLIIESFNFVLIDADEYTLRYMELHDSEFPKANIKKILQKVKEKLTPIYKDFVAEFVNNKLNFVVYDVLRDKLYKIMGPDWCEHEMITLARHFSGVCQPPCLNRDFIRKLVHTELKKYNWDDMIRMQESFRARDKDKSGYIPRESAYNLIRSCKLPLDKMLVERMLDFVVKNEKGDIQEDDFFKFIDIGHCPVRPIIPENVIRQLCNAVEHIPQVGRLIDMCAFNKALNLEHLFKTTNSKTDENEEQKK